MVSLFLDTGGMLGGMKAFVVPLVACMVLASCAPTITGPVMGRIVNGQTGEEGTVSFTRDSLRPRIGDPFAADNATISIGGKTYTGRTVMLEGTVAPLSGGWGLSLGFGNRYNSATNAFGWDTQLDSPRPERTTVRTGNLIAKTADARPQTLTCTLNANTYEHGVGDCVGNDGTKYALQF